MTFAASRRRRLTAAESGQLGSYLTDPYTKRAGGEPRRDHVTVALVGGGFAGRVTAARLKEAGYNNEGQGPSPHAPLAGYSAGAPACFRYIGQWRRSGDFEGLQFSRTG